MEPSFKVGIPFQATMAGTSAESLAVPCLDLLKFHPLIHLISHRVRVQILYSLVFLWLDETYLGATFWRGLVSLAINKRTLIF